MAVFNTYTSALFSSMSDMSYDVLVSFLPTNNNTSTPSLSSLQFTWNSETTGQALTAGYSLFATESNYYDFFVPHDINQAPLTFQLHFNIAAFVSAFILSNATVTMQFYAADNTTHTDISLGINVPFVFDTYTFDIANFGNNGLAHDVAYVNVIPNQTNDAFINVRLLIESTIPYTIT